MIFLLLYLIVKDTVIYANNSIVEAVIDCSQGLAIGMLLAGIVMSSRYGIKIRSFKQRVLKKVV